MRKLDVFDYEIYMQYFSELGVAFISGGIIIILTTEKLYIRTLAIDIVIVGFVMFFLGVWFKIKREKFKEDLYRGLLGREKKNKNK